MRNKLVATALVLGFSLAPMSAFATDLTTVQGGTPIYTCISPAQLFGSNCVTPATSHDTQQVTPAHSYLATRTITGTKWYSASCAAAYSGNYRQNPDTGICYWVPNPSSDNWFPSDNIQTNTYAYLCPNGGTLNTTNCDVPQTTTTVSTPIPATTTPATVSGSNGGSLIASVSGFLSPVWDFIQTKLLPAIGALVLLGIGVRLSIKAVRKYSKVA